MTSAACRVKRRRGFAVLAAAPVIVVLGALSACGSSGNDNSAASRIERQIAASASSPLSIQGEYSRDDNLNEAWIETLPKAASAMNLPTKDDCRDLHPWLRSHSGVDSISSGIDIVLRARRKAKVAITAAESVILKRYPAIRAGYTLTCVPVKYSYVDQEETLNWPDSTPGFALDVNHDLGTPWRPANNASSGYEWTMEPGNEQHVELTGYTSRCNCAWGVELSLTVNGSSKRVLVENGSQPFRTMPAPAYPDDSSRNAVWCAYSDQPRLDPPDAADCRPPTTYENVPVY